jgi:hypothetical protein
MAAHSALATTPGVYQLFVFMLLPFAAGTGRLMRRDGRAMAGETLSPGTSSWRRKPASAAVGQRRRAPGR